MQFVPLTDGTYFINRWFASIESIPKMIVPIGYVGVVVSYYGRSGNDVSGQAFRHGERVAEGERGVQEKPLGPGKYAFNTYAGNIVLVPTTNFVLHWVTGRTESHRYDESLRSIEMVTKDAYEPSLPLSVVVHIDYQKAPNVIQRFGDVKKLITQTLDPMLSAYFRDVAHKRTMLELLQNRDSIQHEASGELGRKFGNFDIECVDVLIGKPDTEQAGGKIETLLEQLRLRQLSLEQVETYTKQVAAAQTLCTLNEAQAKAQMQTQLSNSLGADQDCGERSRGPARPGRKQAEQVVVTAEAESEQRILAGRGEGARILQEGFSEASVLLRKIQSFSDPRLYALSIVAQGLSKCNQPLVPERVFISGGGGGTGGPSDGSDERGGAGGQRRVRALAQHAGRGEIRVPARRSARRCGPARVHRNGRQAGDGRNQEGGRDEPDRGPAPGQRRRKPASRQDSSSAGLDGGAGDHATEADDMKQRADRDGEASSPPAVPI